MGEGFGEIEKRRIHRAPNGEVGAGSAPANANDVDDRALICHQMRPRRPAKAHGPKKLQSKTVTPILITQLQKITALGCPGIVDQNIYAPEPLNGRRNNPRSRLGFA